MLVRVGGLRYHTFMKPMAIRLKTCMYVCTHVCGHGQVFQQPPVARKISAFVVYLFLVRLIDFVCVCVFLRGVVCICCSFPANICISSSCAYTVLHFVQGKSSMEQILHAGKKRASSRYGTAADSPPSARVTIILSMSIERKLLATWIVAKSQSCQVQSFCRKKISLHWAKW